MTPPTVFTKGVALTLLDCPAKVLVPPEPPSEIMEIGLAGHKLILGQGDDLLVVEAPDWRTKAAKEVRDAARLEGRTPILRHKMEQAMAMAQAVMEQLLNFESPVPITNGVPEETIFWEEDGVPCRITPDWRRYDGLAFDELKITQGSAHPAGISRTLFDKGYDLGIALYQRGLRKKFGGDWEGRLVTAEYAPPHAVSVVALDPQALEFANAKLDRALAIWRQCSRTGVWPGYPTRTAYAEVPPYLITQWESRGYYETEAP